MGYERDKGLVQREMKKHSFLQFHVHLHVDLQPLVEDLFSGTPL